MELEDGVGGQAGPLPCTSIAVDNFEVKYAERVSVYFLTHMHADHTIGLHDGWSLGTIYCSSITRLMLLAKFKIEPLLVVALTVGESHMVPLLPSRLASASVATVQGQDMQHSEYCVAELFDAEHCPGSAMLLLTGYFGTYLHTGDFRSSQAMLHKLAARGIGSTLTIDKLFLDATFSENFWSFPSRSQAISQIIRLIEDHGSTTRVFLECEMVGTEPIIVAIASHFRTRVYLDTVKYQQAVVIPGMEEHLTEDPKSTRFFICPFKTFSSLLAKKVRKSETLPHTMRPRASMTAPPVTASCLRIKPSVQWFGAQCSRPDLSKYLTRPCKSADAWHILFSIHSSYSELLGFVSQVRPRHVIPVTECSAAALQQMRDSCDSSPSSEVIVPDKLLQLYPMLARQLPGRPVRLQHSMSAGSVNLRGLSDSESDDGGTHDTLLDDLFSDEESHSLGRTQSLGSCRLGRKRLKPLRRISHGTKGGSMGKVATKLEESAEPERKRMKRSDRVFSTSSGEDNPDSSGTQVELSSQESFAFQLPDIISPSPVLPMGEE